MIVNTPRGEFETVVIGITGEAGSGKDSFCDALMDHVGGHVTPHRVAFADPLKRTCAEMFGVDVGVFHDREKKEVEDERLGMTPRKMLQWFGTDVVRNVDPDHWVKRMPKEIADRITECHNVYTQGGKTIRRMFELVIISDVRFPNEADWVKSVGGTIIKVERDNNDVGEMDHSHASETEIKKVIPDLVVDNNSSRLMLNLSAISTLTSMGLR